MLLKWLHVNPNVGCNELEKKYLYRNANQCKFFICKPVGDVLTWVGEYFHPRPQSGVRCTHPYPRWSPKWRETASTCETCPRCRWRWGERQRRWSSYNPLPWNRTGLWFSDWPFLACIAESNATLCSLRHRLPQWQKVLVRISENVKILYMYYFFTHFPSDIVASQKVTFGITCSITYQVSCVHVIFNDMLHSPQRPIFFIKCFVKHISTFHLCI